MNTRIKILSDAAINQIAAGEVVERPASVVKELVENSLDSKAGSVRIVVTDGGKQLIQITDNGIGMSEQDALLSVQRHTTSKIETGEDLNRIETYGFRGEALASIAAISMMELKTKNVLSDAAFQLEVRAGEIVRQSKTASNTGTTVTVRNLFFNTPGRRNFLRTRPTELRHIAAVVKRLALANCNTEFEFIADDATVWHLPKGTLKQRLVHLYGREIENNILEISRKNGQYEVFGFIGTPEYVKKQKNDQLFFVNGRFIRNRTVNHAVQFGYRTTLDEGKSPFYVIFLNTDPELIDINVHPAKMEAKFVNEQEIHRLISNTVKNRVLTTPVELNANSNMAERNLISPEFIYKSEQAGKYSSQSTLKHDNAGAETLDIVFRNDREVKPEQNDFSAVPDKVWQVHNKFLISQIKSGLIIIDQHAAHERILYEKALKMFKEKKRYSQQLLFPKRIELPKEDIFVFDEISPLLELLGFELRVFGRDSVVIEAVPNDLRKGNEEKIFKDIINEYKKDEYKSLDLYHRVASSVACRGAIMTGDSLSTQEMNKLIDQLFATEHPFFCPHGRPTIVNLSLKDLDKMFGRIG